MEQIDIGKIISRKCNDVLLLHTLQRVRLFFTFQDFTLTTTITFSLVFMAENGVRNIIAVSIYSHTIKITMMMIIMGREKDYNSGKRATEVFVIIEIVF